MSKRECAQNESDAKRIHVEHSDVFAFEDTTSLIISYLGEDAKFCFSLTSKKNKQRVDLFRLKDVLYQEDMKDPLFRRARILYDAAKEGHVDVIRYLALDERVRVNIICGPRFIDHPLFEPFTFRHVDYYRCMDIAEKYKAPRFSYKEGLLLCEVSSRYGKKEVESNFNDINWRLKCRDEDITANIIIGGHLHLFDTEKEKFVYWNSMKKILQRASAGDIEKVVREEKYGYVEISWEDLIHRGDVRLFDSLKRLEEKIYPKKTEKTMYLAALLSGNVELIERVCIGQEGKMDPDEMKERYVGKPEMVAGIERFSACKEMTDVIVASLIKCKNDGFLDMIRTLGSCMMRKRH